MSTRGINFLHKWLSENVPETAGANVISVNDLTRKLIADARSVGVRREEIYEEVHSVYHVILDAIVHYEPGLAD